jgi:hypothetical protein
MSAWETVSNRLAGAFGQEEASEAWREFFDVGVSVPVAADAAANTNTAITKIWSNPFSYPVKVEVFEINADAAIAVNGSNYVDMTISRDDGADTAPVTCATRSTINTSTNIAAVIDAAFTLTPGNCTVAAGGNIFRTYAKQGSGFQLPAHTLKMRLRRV